MSNCSRWPTQTFNFSSCQANSAIISDIEKLHDRISKNKNLIVSKNITQLTHRDASADLLASSIICSLKEYIQIIYRFEVNFSKLWYVNTDFLDVKRNELPYVTHIDKDRYIKILIYLRDVGINDGPFHISKLCAKWIEGLRLSLPLDYKQRKLNCLPYLPDNYVPIPIIGQKGNMCIFDTNSPHHAGIVKRNHRRWAARFDFTLNT